MVNAPLTTLSPRDFHEAFVMGILVGWCCAVIIGGAISTLIDLIRRS